MDYFKTVDPEDMSQAKLIVFEKGLLQAPNSLFYIFHLSKEPITFIYGSLEIQIPVFLYPTETRNNSLDNPVS